MTIHLRQHFGLGITVGLVLGFLLGSLVGLSLGDELLDTVSGLFDRLAGRRDRVNLQFLLQ
jgi:hypothetical protein